MMYTVLDQRLSLATVVTMAGAYTTVDITRTFPSLADPAGAVSYDSYIFWLVLISCPRNVIFKINSC